MNRLLLVATCIALSAPPVRAQQPDIENYLTMIENGQAEPVRAELPSLLGRYPGHPGVLYLQAVLTTDGSAAVRMYHDIVEKFPASEWADDALFKVYKYYTSIELMRTAELKANELRSRYPNSKYIASLPPPATTSADVRTSQPVAAPKETVAVTTTSPPPQAEPKPETPPAPPVREAPTERYALQVGAFSTLANANAQKSFFEFHNHVAEVVSKVVGSRELYVVLVGNYASREEARSKGDELQRAFNMKSIVVPR